MFWSFSLGDPCNYACEHEILVPWAMKIGNVSNLLPLVFDMCIRLCVTSAEACPSAGSGNVLELFLVHPTTMSAHPHDFPCSSLVFYMGGCKFHVHISAPCVLLFIFSRSCYVRIMPLSFSAWHLVKKVCSVDCGRKVHAMHNLSCSKL